MGDTSLKDVYGLEVNRDYLELLQTYQPLWLKAEVSQSRKWTQFLNNAAQQLGKQAEGQNRVDLNDASCEGIICDVLRELSRLGERHAPDLCSELIKLVHDGVPNALRPCAWPVFLAADKHSQPGYYSKLVALHQRLCSSSSTAASDSTNSRTAASTPPEPSLEPLTEPSTTPSEDCTPAATATAAPQPAEKETAAAAAALGIDADALLLWRSQWRTWQAQIDKDCHRTFPGHDWLSSPAGQAVLHRVLSCFCLKAPQLGYCQGMNFVAGGLLLVLTSGGRRQQQQPAAAESLDTSAEAADSAEALAFGCLLAVAQDVLPGYYSPAMVAPQVDQAVLGHLIGEHFPQLGEHLVMLGVEPSQPVPGWLLGGYVSSGMPFEAIARLWDVAFFERSGAGLVRACLALFHLFGAAFLSSQDVIDASLLLQAMPGLAFDADRLLLVAGEVYKDLNPEALQALQHCFRFDVVAELERAAAAAAAASRKQQQRLATAVSPAAAELVAAVAAAAAAADEAAATQDAAAAAEGGAAGAAGGAQQQQQQQQQQSAVAAAVDGSSDGGGPAVAALPRSAGGAGCWTGEEVVLHEEWVPQFEGSSAPAAAAAAAAVAGVVTAASTGSGGSGADGAGAADAAAGVTATASDAEQQQQQQQVVAGVRCRPPSRAMTGDGDDDDDGDDEEGGSPLLQQGHQQQQQQQQSGKASGSDGSGATGSGSSSGGGTAAGGSGGSGGDAAAAGSFVGGQRYRILAEPSSTRSKAIAQAYAIAAAPGLLPAAPTVLPKQQQQQQQQQYARTNSAGSLTAAASAFFGLHHHNQQQQQHSQQQRQLYHQLSLPSLFQQHNKASPQPQPSSRSGELGTSSQQQQQQEGLWRQVGSGSGGRQLVIRSTDDDDGEGGWMLLGSTPPSAAAGGGVGSPVGAAARKAAAAAAAHEAGGAAGGTCCLPVCEGADQQQQQQQWQQQPCMTEDELRDELRVRCGLQAAQDAWKSAAAAAAAAAEQQQQQADDSGSPRQHCCQSAALLARYAAVIDMALSCAEGLVAELSGRDASAAALENQLARSMMRLEQQDAESATKDELIERLQLQLTHIRPAAAASPTGNSSSMQDHQQPSGRVGSFSRFAASLGSVGSSSSGSSAAAGAGAGAGAAAGVHGGSAGSFVSSALARFSNSPTKPSKVGSSSSSSSSSAGPGLVVQQHQMPLPLQQQLQAGDSAEGSSGAANGTLDADAGGSAAGWRQRLMSIKMLKHKEQQEAAAAAAGGDSGSSGSSSVRRSLDNGKQLGPGVEQQGPLSHEQQALPVVGDVPHKQQQQQQQQQEFAEQSVLVVGGGQPHLPPAAAAHLNSSSAAAGDAGLSYSQYVALDRGETGEQEQA